MKTLFFGTSEFAVPSLRVVAQHTTLIGVITQPDRPSGRGQKLHPTPVNLAAQDLGVRVYRPMHLDAVVEEMSKGSLDLIVLASYGKILPKAILDVPRLGALNVHPSLLPKYRGATPIQSALANGDTETGVSIMMMDAGMDTGNIVVQERVDILATDDYGTLHDRLAEAGARLLVRALALAEEGRLTSHPQRGAASVTKPLRKDDLRINWSWPARRIVNVVRSLSPKPLARASLDDDTVVKVVRASVSDLPARDVQIGGVFRAPWGALLVRTGDGTLCIEELIAPNHSRETGTEYLARINFRKMLES